MPAEPLKFTLPVSEFDTAVLPQADREAGSERFREAVKRYYRTQFASVGGTVDVEVDDEIRVSWEPRGATRGVRDQAAYLLRRGKLQDAVPYLQIALLENPDDTESLYNLGMVMSDLKQLDTAIAHLTRAVTLAPENVNARVALGVAYQRHGDSDDAQRVLEEAIALDPDNGYALRNLGAVVGEKGRLYESAEYLRDAYRVLPRDLQTVYGLALTLEQLGDAEGDDNLVREADTYYERAIRLDPASPIADHARDARTRLAQRNFKEKTPSVPRMDAVMYCLAAIQRFDEMTPAKVQEITFEIALLGQRGLDTNNLEHRYTLRTLPGDFSGLQLVSYMYVGFQRIDPSLNVGFDLSAEYAAAQQLAQMKRGQ